MVRGLSKKDVADLCKRFGGELIVVAKTIVEIMDNMDSQIHSCSFLNIMTYCSHGSHFANGMFFHQT